MTRTSHHEIFAEYFQFFLQDDGPPFGDLSQAWTKEATGRLLAVAPHVIGVGTVRNVTVPVTVAVHEARPEIDEAAWDHIATASLQVASGRIVVAGFTGYYPEAARIEVEPGVYKAIVCYANLDSVSPDGWEGEDSYHVHLFPGREIRPATIKRRSGCPRCQRLLPSGTSEDCPFCGVVFAKLYPVRSRIFPSTDPPPLISPIPQWVIRLASRLRWANTVPKLLCWSAAMAAFGAYFYYDLATWEKVGGRRNFRGLERLLYQVGGKGLVLIFFLTIAGVFATAAFYAYRAQKDAR